MDAKKCDRCGKYYDYYSGISPDKDMAKALRIDSVNSALLTFTSMNSTRNKCFSEDIDLCPICMSELLEWMKGGKYE